MKAELQFTIRVEGVSPSPIILPIDVAIALRDNLTEQLATYTNSITQLRAAVIPEEPDNG